MTNVVSETSCTRCVHKDVCKHKLEFIYIINKFMQIRLPDSENGVGDDGVCLNDVDYIDVAIRCKHERAEGGIKMTYFEKWKASLTPEFIAEGLATTGTDPCVLCPLIERCPTYISETECNELLLEYFAEEVAE